MRIVFKPAEIYIGLFLCFEVKGGGLIYGDVVEVNREKGIILVETSEKFRAEIEFSTIETAFIPK